MLFFVFQMLLSFVYFAQFLAQSTHAGSLLPFLRRERSNSQNTRAFDDDDDESSVHTEREQGSGVY